MTDTDRKREDEWFLKHEQELIEAARIARAKREQERAGSEQLAETKRLKDLHFMKCPKCGHGMNEDSLEGVTVDRCGFCEGVYFDAGELDRVFLKKEEDRKGFLKKLLQL